VGEISVEWLRGEGQVKEGRDHEIGAWDAPRRVEDIGPPPHGGTKRKVCKRRGAKPGKREFATRVQGPANEAKKGNDQETGRRERDAS